MLATRLEDPRRLADSRYIAEPKLDAQRAQIHVRGGRTVAAIRGPASKLMSARRQLHLRTVLPQEGMLPRYAASPGEILTSEARSACGR
jgi:hypothetical protein